MLQFIREHAQGWIAWVIVGFLIFVFALWGINAYLEPEQNMSVAEVNGKEITSQEFQRSFEEEKFRLQQMLGKNFDPAMFNDQLMKPRILDRLIEEEVQQQAAADAGYRIGDQLVLQQLNEFEEFKRDGKFDVAQYESIIRGQGLSPAAFEARLRRELLMVQPGRGIMNSAFATDYELKYLARLREQERDIGYAIISADRYTDEAVIEEKAINDYYNANRDSFAKPEQVTVDYIELSSDELMKNITVTDEQLHKLYEEQADSFGVEETRRARHILISLKSDADDKAVNEALSKAQAALERLRKGESFEQVAKQVSEDPGSANQGGDLGYFGHGVMDKVFEETAFKLAVNELSEPVRSSFGFHIIQVTDIKVGQKKPFEEVRSKLENDYRREQAEAQYFDKAEKLTDLAFSNPDTLSPAAESLGLQVKTSDWFNREIGQGIASHANVREAAFAEDVLGNGNNSEPIEIGPNHVVVFRVKKHEPSSVRPLEEVKNEIIERLKKEIGAQKAKEQANSLLNEIKAGKDPALITKQLGFEWKRTGLIGRNDAALDPVIREEAFKVSFKKDEKIPQARTVALPNGDYTVTAVYALQDGALPANKDDPAQKSLKQSLAQSTAMNEYRQLISEWKKDSEISSYPDKLN